MLFLSVVLLQLPDSAVSVLGRGEAGLRAGGGRQQCGSERCLHIHSSERGQREERET